MQYELYVDSLFLVNFVMNLYLLLLVDRSTLRTATPGRLLLGAAAGGVCGLLPFLISGSGLFGMMGLNLFGTLGMLFITFPVKGLRMFLKLLERLILYSFCMGGALLFLIRSFPSFRQYLTGIFGILGVGGCCFLFLLIFSESRERQNSLCHAILCCGGRQVEVTALVDSGNSLIEPISGKPVCIIEKQVLDSLKELLPYGCRAIPYHSIGTRLGILEGYLLPELHLEIHGINKRFRKVWIAASPQGINSGETSMADSVKMIISPRLLSEPKRGRPDGRQNERIYDIESGNTGKNAFQNDSQREADLQ